MFKRVAGVFLGCFCLFSALTLSGRMITVSKSTRLNPTIKVEVSGDAALAKDLPHFFRFCGWFDPAAPGSVANYTVRASRSTDGVSVFVYQGNDTNYTAGWRFSSNSNTRELAKVIVDKVIEYLFKDLKVKGFCHSRIAFCAQTALGVRNIYFCDIDGQNVTPVTAYPTLNVEPSWAPDGKTIFFSKYGRSGIEIIETTIATPRRSRRISSFRGINTGAAVSPDGKYMAVILSPDHNVDLYVLGLKQRYRKRLTKGKAVEASPCWSPDGKKLAFVSDQRGNPRVFIINADGSGLTMLPSVGRDAVTPAWSADNKIAYVARPKGSANYVLAVYDMNTKENKVVTKGGGSWESPGWAADNRQVICKRTVDGKSSLWVVDTRSGRERELLRTGSELFDPAWSPCLKR